MEGYIDSDALPPTISKLKDYLGDAISRRLDVLSAYVFVASTDLALSPASYCASIDVAVRSLALYLLGSPEAENESSQDAARTLLKNKFPYVYSNYVKNNFKDIILFFINDASQGLLIYGYADWPQRFQVMSLEGYIQRLKERMASEGFSPEGNLI